MGQKSAFIVLLSFFYICGYANSLQDDDDFFGSDANDVFDQMEREEKFHDALNEGFDNWEDRCVKIGGQKALDDWLKAQEELVYCFLNNFPADQITAEMEARKAKGELDLVFKKYCGKPVDHTRPCLVRFLDVSRACLTPKEVNSIGGEEGNGLNVTLHMIDAAVDFFCKDYGQRLALFMSESGLDCVKRHQDAMMTCIRESIPELFHLKKSQSNINLILFSAQNCKRGRIIRHCVESELLKCPDPTPSNVVNSMMLAMQRATPCKRTSSRLEASKGSAQTELSVKVLFALLAVYPFLN